jgi:hypothetical protein
MIYVYISIIAIISFLGGIYIAIRLLKKEYSGEVISNDSGNSIESSGVIDGTIEDQTRKVELVDFEDLLKIDGDVIEAEPAPVVPEDYLYRAQHEIRMLEHQVKQLEEREQSTQFVMEKLKKDSEDIKS